MLSIVLTLMLNLLRAAVPYPDPIRRRRRVREVARKLVGSPRWPADDAVEGVDVARLALLRLLWLQRECRRVSRRSTECAVLIARSAVETCILGVYCLVSNDAVPSLKAATAKTAQNVLGYLVDDALIPNDVVDKALLAAFGSPKQRPSLGRMAREVESAPNGFRAHSLYRRFYVPTSEFFVHANATSLLRHVLPDDQLSERPTFPWTRRSALHVCDACVAILAGAIPAGVAGSPGSLAQYAEAHMIRAVTPLGAIAGSGFRRSVKDAGLSRWLGVVRSARNVHNYAWSAQALADTPAVRKARVWALFEQAFSLIVSTGLPKEARLLLQDHFVETVVSDIASRAGQHQRAGR